MAEKPIRDATKLTSSEGANAKVYGAFGGGIDVKKQASKIYGPNYGGIRTTTSRRKK